MSLILPLTSDVYMNPSLTTLTVSGPVNVQGPLVLNNGQTLTINGQITNLENVSTNEFLVGSSTTPGSLTVNNSSTTLPSEFTGTTFQILPNGTTSSSLNTQTITTGPITVTGPSTNPGTFTIDGYNLDYILYNTSLANNITISSGINVTTGTVYATNTTTNIASTMTVNATLLQISSELFYAYGSIAITLGSNTSSVISNNYFWSVTATATTTAGTNIFTSANFNPSLPLGGTFTYISGQTGVNSLSGGSDMQLNLPSTATGNYYFSGSLAVIPLTFTLLPDTAYTFTETFGQLFSLSPIP